MTTETVIQKRRSSLRLLIFTAFVLLASSCANDASYNKSADVSCEGWTSADALLFDIHVVDSLRKGETQTLVKGEKYALSISFRYSRKYPYTTIPIHICVGSENYSVFPYTETRNTWSDLYQDVFDLPNVPISFPDTGMYIIKVFPDTTLTDIYSVGIDIR